MFTCTLPNALDNTNATLGLTLKDVSYHHNKLPVFHFLILPTQKILWFSSMSCKQMHYSLRIMVSRAQWHLSFWLAIQFQQLPQDWTDELWMSNNKRLFRRRHSCGTTERSQPPTASPSDILALGEMGTLLWVCTVCCKMSILSQVNMFCNALYSL